MMTDREETLVRALDRAIDDNEKLRAEIDRLRNDAQSAWQPIETAPKDGSRILLFQRDRGAFEGWFHMEGFWMDDQDSEPEPTHWMPLLEAPALPSAQRGSGS